MRDDNIRMKDRVKSYTMKNGRNYTYADYKGLSKAVGRQLQRKCVANNNKNNHHGGQS